jgi:HK97 family phage prohead protease
MAPREYASFPMELAQVETTGRTMKGWASVYDHPIQGPGWPNITTFMRRGAFTKTLAENRDMFQVMFNHGLDPRYGELPIGTITKLEDQSHGLWAEVELHDGPDNANIVAALRSKALRAMSVQFEPIKAPFNEDHTERSIEEVRLWEFGPVSFPANAAATASLHSLAGFAALAQPLDPKDAGGTMEHDNDQADALAKASRLTWARDAGRTLELKHEELEREGARLKALGGGSGIDQGADPAVARQAREHPRSAG